MQTSETINTAKQHEDEQVFVDAQAAKGNTEQVDLSRRRLFAWGARNNLNKVSSRHSGENVDGHEGVVVQRSVDEEGVEFSGDGVVAVQAITVIDLLAKFISETSSKGQLTCYQDLPQLLRNYEEPLHVIVACEQAESDDGVEWEQVSTLCELDDAKAQEIVDLALRAMMQADNTCHFIEVAGKKDRYYYDSRLITANYVRMLVLMADEQHWQTLAEMTRFECKTYPRPYSVLLLQESPFNLSAQEVEMALDVLSNQQQCGDIKRVSASNGALYLYSQAYMVEALAQSLCEWIEVGQFDNP